MRVLATAGSPSPHASVVLANLLLCEVPSANPDADPQQFAPPVKVVNQLLTREATLDCLPRIELYSTSAQFDQHFCYRRQGWHPEVGFLIHGDHP